jgi:transposase-like protein
MAKRTRRSFTPQFKAEVVLAILTGAQSQAEVCRAHGLKPELVALWKKTFLERLPSVFDGTAGDGREAARVAELERLVGRLTLELDVAKKASALLPSVLRNGGRS